MKNKNIKIDIFTLLFSIGLVRTVPTAKEVYEKQEIHLDGGFLNSDPKTVYVNLDS